MYFDRKRNYAKTHQLAARMEQLGYSLRYVAQVLGVPYTTLWHKMNGFGEFHTSEIVGLKVILCLDDADVQDIFLEQYNIFFTCEMV